MDQTLKEIELVLEQFIRAVERQDIEAVSALLTEKACLYSSNLGNTEGKSEISRRFRWKGPQLSYVRIRGFANHTRYHNGVAQQSVILAGLLDDTAAEYKPLRVYSRFCITYQKEKDDWKISVIRNVLDWIFGELGYVKDWWDLPNDENYMGCSSSPIIGELDAPWIVIPQNDAVLSVKEEIQNVYYRYAFCLECGDYISMKEILCEDVVFDDYAIDEKGTITHLRFNGIRELYQNFKSLRHHFSTFEHAGILQKIEQKDETHAEVEMFNGPNFPFIAERRENRDCLTPMYRYRNTLVYQDGKWKISHFLHEPTTERIPYEEGRYFY